MRHPSPFSNLDTESFFDDARSDGISHSDSFLFSVFNGSGSVPIPWDEIVVHLMAQIQTSDVDKPHGEGAVAVNGELLEVSVHFVSS